MRSLELHPLAYKVPVNAAEFDEASRHAFVKNAFRIGGVAVQQGNGGYRVFVSHHYWKSADRCWVMRVSSLEGTLDDLMSERAVLKWKTAFETRPCMPLSLPGHPPRFGALESGASHGCRTDACW